MSDLLRDASEAGARGLVERMALMLQAAILLKAGNPLAGVFIESRLSRRQGMTYGQLSPDDPFDVAIDRALP
jgi:putative acyl-CoA dehydrogenase